MTQAGVICSAVVGLTLSALRNILNTDANSPNALSVLRRVRVSLQ